MSWYLLSEEGNCLDYCLMADDLDCGIYVHEECETFIPDFCGLRRADALKIASTFRESSSASSTCNGHGLLGVGEPEEPRWPQFSVEQFENLAVIGKGNFGKVLPHRLSRHAIESIGDAGPHQSQWPAGGTKGSEKVSGRGERRGRQHSCRAQSLCTGCQRGLSLFSQLFWSLPDAGSVCLVAGC